MIQVTSVKVAWELSVLFMNKIWLGQKCNAGVLLGAIMQCTCNDILG